MRIEVTTPIWGLSACVLREIDDLRDLRVTASSEVDDSALAAVMKFECVALALDGRQALVFSDWLIEASGRHDLEWLLAFHELLARQGMLILEGGPARDVTVTLAEVAA